MKKSKKSNMLSFIGITKTLSQYESKRLPQFVAVLEYILKNPLFSATQLEHSTNVSRDSIDRTIKKLFEENLIKFKETRNRGEKLYKTISKTKLEKKLHYSKNWWYAKVMFKPNLYKEVAKLKKTASKGVKRSMYRVRILNDSDQQKQIWFISKKTQSRFTKISFPNPVIINELPFTEAIKIINYFHNGSFCEICFIGNKFSLLTTDEAEQICESGHVHTIFQTINKFDSSHFPIHKSKKLSDSEFKEQRKNYLKNLKTK